MKFLIFERTFFRFLAACLTAGDRLGLPEMPEVVSILFGGVFGSCVMPEDERLMLKLLHHLMRAQLASAPNPRKLLRQKNCAFSRLYKVCLNSSCVVQVGQACCVNVLLPLWFSGVQRGNIFFQAVFDVSPARSYPQLAV